MAWKRVVDAPLGFTVTESAGGLIAADITGNRQQELIVTAPGRLAAFAPNGKQLWMREIDIRVSAGSSENTGLPGHHAPGVQVADIDGDTMPEVLLLDQNDTIIALDGRTGRDKYRWRVDHPEGSERWEHLVVANLRGAGDQDLLLQTTNARGYRMGRYVSAFSIDPAKLTPLWSTDRYVGCAHSGLRVADIDGDGRDEVLGSTLIWADGRIQTLFEHRGHLDSLFVGDVRPDLPGLEVVFLEEGGGNHVFLANSQGLIWSSHHRNQEPQNAALGNFSQVHDGLEIWCRSRYDTDQKPFVFDMFGNVLTEYALQETAPPDWTRKGVEVIFTIDWTGRPTQLCAAKARHESGDVCIFEPMTGRFVERIEEQADRLYVADVSGDWREELVVISGERLRVYQNPDRNPVSNRRSLWRDPAYRRNKMTWNYYNP